MTSLERAKQFVARKGRVLALSIVPLASVVVADSALAQQTFTPGVCVIGASGSSTVVFSGSCAFQAEPAAGSNGVTGVKLLGGTGGGTPTVTYTGPAGGSGSVLLDIFGSGGATLTGFTGAIPIRYAFTPQSTDTADTISYNLIYSLFDGTNNIGSFNLSSSVTSGTNVTGTGFITPSFVSQSADGYSIELILSQSSAAINGNASISAVNTNLELNQAASASPVPEPATVTLLLSGVGLLVIRKRRRAG